MTNDLALLRALTFACALGAGLIAGTFFAFSAFVMKALRQLPVAHGIAAMQSINVVVLNPWFLSVFVGTALGSLALVISDFFVASRSGHFFASIGGAFYLLGTFMVTAGLNVPLNDALAKLDPANAKASDVWNAYVLKWSAWNHVRTIAALIACALFIAAIRAAR